LRLGGLRITAFRKAGDVSFSTGANNSAEQTTIESQNEEKTWSEGGLGGGGWLCKWATVLTIVWEKKKKSGSPTTDPYMEDSVLVSCAKP